MVEWNHLGRCGSIDRYTTRWHVIDRVIEGSFVIRPDDSDAKAGSSVVVDLDGLFQFFGLDRIMQSGEGEFVEPSVAESTGTRSSPVCSSSTGSPTTGDSW